MREEPFMPTAKTLARKLVLVVDDDADIRESVSQPLDINGYCAVQAENGQKALTILKETTPSPSLILLDMTCNGRIPISELSCSGSGSVRDSSDRDLRAGADRSSTQGDRRLFN